jgi:hypothetical protein
LAGISFSPDLRLAQIFIALVHHPLIWCHRTLRLSISAARIHVHQNSSKLLAHITT